MEEYIGTVWHRLITRRANADYADARVDLHQLAPALTLYFRAMGGDAGKTLEASTHRHWPVYQRLIDRIAGKKHFIPAWQDERSVRLPASVALFPDRDLNEHLYFWLTGLAANLPVVQHWSTDNQAQTLALLARRPGLAARYRVLAQAYCDLRQAYYGAKLPRTEYCIQQAILQPGSITHLPPDSRQCLPVSLWLYPSPLQEVNAEFASDDLDDSNPSASNARALRIGRKAAQRTNDEKETDGLLAFRLESLFSWTEQIDLDRPQEEDVEDDAAAAAEDMDIITLSRHRRACSGRLRFDMDLPSPVNDDLPLGDGIRLPEWDFRKQRMKNDFCLLQPFLADDAEPIPFPDRLKPDAARIKRLFSQLQPEKLWSNRQLYGDDIDINAWIEHQSKAAHDTETPACFRQRYNAYRDMSCLLLADLSMSTDCAVDRHTRVIDVIRNTLMVFCEALSQTNDRLAVYGFSSVRNKQIRYHLIKNFNETFSERVLGRIQALKPGYYTRMGAAIRQSTEILKTQQTDQKLLLIMSDGKPNDLDQYEGRYGIEDTRHAFLHAKREGIRPFCVTIDADANEYLPYIFGEQGYSVVTDPAKLTHVLPQLYSNLTKR